jgi:diguanylate cyclase (GGDEF)-like protein/PAS domain S-box-containing protein
MADTITNNFGAAYDGDGRDGIERRLEDPEARYRALIEHVPAVTYAQVVDRGEPIVHMSPQVEAMLGYGPEEWLVDREFSIKLLHPEDRERVLAEHLRASQSGEPLDTEYRLIARDGRTVWVRDEAVLVRDETGCPLYWQGVMIDVTERRVLEERLRHQALHDPLTDLPNRTLLLDRLGQALEGAGERRKKVALLFMDLDNFKHVNDSLGHEAGDRLLVEVATRLRSSLRAEDTVARLGGDEFVVLSENLRDRRGAAAVAQRVARALQPPIPLDGHEVFVTTSIGIAFGGPGEDRPETLLRDAEIAMYRVKESGKNHCEIFCKGMGESSSKRLRMEEDLRGALARGEFVVH